MRLTEVQNGAARPAACLILLAGLALLLAPAPASAHAKLLRSQPKSGESLGAPPRVVELWFSTELTEGFSTIEVTDAGGGRVDRGEVKHAEGGKKAQVELGELPPGDYTVVWKVVSVDEHTIRGKFSFKVAAAAAATPSPGPAIQATTPPGAGGESGHEATAGSAGGQQAEASSSGESTITWLDNLVRWLAYLAMMTLFGGFASRLFVLGPAFETAGDAGGTREGDAAASRRTVTLLRAGATLLLPTLLAALALQSSSVNGVGVAEALSPALLGRVVTGTGYGRAWLVTTVSAVAVAVVAFLLGRDSPPRGRRGLWWVGLIASAAMLLGPSLTGHAMAAGRHHLAVVSDWLHLAAGGFWVGGLFHLALATPAALARLGAEERGRPVGRVIKLFTRVAVPSVAMVSLAGLYSAWIHLGSVSALWGTPYGRTLLVKLLLVAPMLLLGAVNAFRNGPRAERLAAAGDREGQTAVEGDFLRSVKVEAALGVLVLLAAAVLVFVTPGRNDAMEAGGGARAGQQEVRGR